MMRIFPHVARVFDFFFFKKGFTIDPRLALDWQSSYFSLLGVECWDYGLVPSCWGTCLVFKSRLIGQRANHSIE